LSRPFALDGDAVASLVVVRADALRRTSGATRLAVFDEVVDAGAGAAVYPQPLAAVDRTLVPPRIVRRYSSMTLAVQRLHTPMLQWLRTCAPEARRRFLIDGLRRPGQSARWLAARAARVWRSPNPPTPPEEAATNERNVRTGTR
jgi:hypothetical protein